MRYKKNSMMKNSLILNEKLILEMSFQERRIINYVAAKKSNLGVFPATHASDSKRCAAFCLLVKKGFIIILEKKGNKIYFELSNKLIHQGVCKFSISTGLYLKHDNHLIITKSQGLFDLAT